jgi:N-methylhydantoinase A
VIQRYLDNLVTRLNKRFGEVRLHIMQSNGGSMTVETAKKYASQLINSGPAGGAIATAFVSRITGNEMAVGADMGGTTFDISIIDKNLPRTTTWGGVTEYPIKLPMVDMKTIGAGGGSIAWVDQSRVLHVGPQSAGSDPGPACYNWGGVLPTVSDANCLLGRLNPNYFLGGKMVLQPELAHRAIHQHVADKMGISVEEAALGIIRIVNANMAKGISGNSVEKGYDLREFVLVTLGGAAALHAADLGRELNIGRIIVPPMSGNFSAVGLVVADIQHDYVKTIATNQYDISPQHLLSEFKRLQDQGIGQLKEEKVKEEQIAIQWSGDLRYDGQSWELNTPIKPRERLAKEDIDQIVSSFHNLHQQVYSYCEPDEIVEFVNIRVTVKGMSSTLTLPQMDSNPVELNKALKEKRAVYFAEKGYRDTAVYERELLMADTIIPGPCIIEEPICTTLVPDDCRAQVDHFGDLIITFNQVK